MNWFDMDKPEVTDYFSYTCSHTNNEASDNKRSRHGPLNNITKNQPQFSQVMMGQYWLDRNKFSDQYALSESCYGFFLKLFNRIFY